MFWKRLLFTYIMVILISLSALGYIVFDEIRTNLEDQVIYSNEIILENGIEEIIIAINERSRDEILNIVAYGEYMGVSFKIIPQMYDVILGHKTEEVIGHPLIRILSTISPEFSYVKVQVVQAVQLPFCPFQK